MTTQVLVTPIPYFNCPFILKVILVNVHICLTMFGGQVSTFACGNQLQRASCLSCFPNRKRRAQVLVTHSCILCPWIL